MHSMLKGLWALHHTCRGIGLGNPHASAPVVKGGVHTLLAALVHQDPVVVPRGSCETE